MIDYVFFYGLMLISRIFFYGADIDAGQIVFSSHGEEAVTLGYVMDMDSMEFRDLDYPEEALFATREDNAYYRFNLPGGDETYVDNAYYYTLMDWELLSGDTVGTGTFDFEGPDESLWSLTVDWYQGIFRMEGSGYFFELIPEQY